MCSESFPKEFEKVSEVLPFTKYGLSTLEEFKSATKDIKTLEWLKKVGLTSEEIKLYQENEEGTLDHRKKMEANVMRMKLKAIYDKINNLVEESTSSEEEPSTCNSNSVPSIPETNVTIYPEGHPMNNIKDIEKNLCDHLKRDDIIPITKRRKILRRLQRKSERLLSQDNHINITLTPSTSKVDRPGSLWDVREVPRKTPKAPRKSVIGPQRNTMYTIKDKKIVRLEPVNPEKQEYQAVDIVLPVNDAEAHLLEGTKMSVDNIKQMARFKDYEPGIPSKVLYLKNIAPSVTQEQLSLLFNQFVHTNGGPIDVRLMSGRMRGQAFVAFQNEDIAIQALEETNGTILNGQPVIVQFGRSTNQVQD